MKIYPAIDLIDGQCVRLEQGRFENTKVYDQSPLDIAKQYADAGAMHLHVIDLDGARATTSQQAELVIALGKDSGLKVQSGGGIRSGDHIERLLNGGVEKVILGSLAVRDPDTVKGFLKRFGAEHITLALDVRVDERGVPMTATEGWLSGGDASIWDVLDFYAKTTLPSLLCTDIARDGMLLGPNVALYRKILERYPNLEVQASGGVATVNDLEKLKAAGCGAVVIGKALLEGRFTLGEALHAG